MMKPMQSMGPEMFDQMLSLARDNDAKSIDMLLRMGCPPTYCNKVGQSALHIGAIWGSVDAVKVLLQAKANPNQQNKLRGSTPLHAAAMGRGPLEKRAECVKLIVQYKGDPKRGDNTGELPMEATDDEVLRTALGAAPLHLHNAVQARNSQTLAAVVQQMRMSAVGALNNQNAKGETALVMALGLSWREGAEMLIRAGADVSLPDNFSQGPLHKAVLRGDHRAVALLLEASADANAKDRDPDHDSRFVSKTVEENPWEHRTPLHYAAQLGNMVAVNMLVEKGKADVNAADCKLQTPLHLALELRRQGADLEVGSGVRVQGLQKRPDWNGRLGSVIGERKSDEGYNSKTAATTGGSSASAPARWPVLLDGDSSDGVLLKADNLESLADIVIDRLLEAGADVGRGHRLSGELQTTLHMAAHDGDSSLMGRLLPKASAAVMNQQDKSGFTALHVAARGRHHEVAKQLVEARAYLTLAAANGKTALELARTNGADAAMLTVLGGSASEEADPSKVAPVKEKQTLGKLSAEQRAALFID